MLCAPCVEGLGKQARDLRGRLRQAVHETNGLLSNVVVALGLFTWWNHVARPGKLRNNKPSLKK
jgi:hypothetical protein